MAVVVSYTTVSLMLETLGEIQSMMTVNSAEIAVNASAAQNEINSKIVKRYALPFSVDIPILETLCTDMGIYRVLTGRIIITEDDEWFLRYKAASGLLDEIAAGSASLLTSSFDLMDPRADAAGGGSAWSNDKDYHPIHSELPWTQHFPDEDKIEELEDERDLDGTGGLLK